MRIYLDNCCFNRPFDDQSQVRIRIESEAKLCIQTQIREGKFDLAWSYILDYENNANPFSERKQAIVAWKQKAKFNSIETDEILKKAKEFVSKGLREKDALHRACAISSQCKYFLTTDDEIIKIGSCIIGISVEAISQAAMRSRSNQSTNKRSRRTASHLSERQ